MNSQARSSKRRYESSLRARQTRETRERILEALAEQLADAGLKDFSIEQVARRAGVAPRTVYHHFPNRDDLMDGVTAWLDEQAVGGAFPDAPTITEFTDHITRVFEAFDTHEAFIRAQLVTELGQAVRRRGRSQRRPVIESIVRREAPGLSPAEARRATALIHYITSSEAWRSMKDESGLSGPEAGKAVIWAIRTLLAELSNRNGGPGVHEEGEEQ